MVAAIIQRAQAQARTCPVCRSVEFTQRRDARYCSKACYLESNRRESFRRWQENRDAILERCRVDRQSPEKREAYLERDRRNRVKNRANDDYRARMRERERVQILV